jgi:hypothetical protein
MRRILSRQAVLSAEWLDRNGFDQSYVSTRHKPSIRARPSSPRTVMFGSCGSTARSARPGSSSMMKTGPCRSSKPNSARPSAKRSGRRWAETSETHPQHGQEPTWFLPSFLFTSAAPVDRRRQRLHVVCAPATRDGWGPRAHRRKGFDGCFLSLVRLAHAGHWLVGAAPNSVGRMGFIALAKLRTARN